MEELEKEVKKQLRKHLRGVGGPTIENLVKRLGGLPIERVLLTTDIGVMLAGTNLRAGVEMLKAAPEVSRLIEAGDIRVWGEVGKRLSATSAETAVGFFQSSAAILESIPEDLRSPLLRLVNKQAALSAHTSIECFRSAPGVIEAFKDPEDIAQILTICLELARHSVKHSNDLFLAAPQVISQIETQADTQSSQLIKRALTLTSCFAFRSGGTAAEFFGELPSVIIGAEHGSVERLFDITESYLDRSGGVALQYFKAASRVLTIAGKDSFERWTALAKRVALQGNAASYHFMKQSPHIVAELAGRVGAQRRTQVVSAVLEIVEEIAERSTIAAVECFKASPLALRAASLGQFRDWARRGLEKTAENSRRVQAYYSLESKASQEALFKIEGGLTLDSIAHTLRLYVEGLTGRSLHIASLASIPDEAKIGDGSTIYLPSVVAEFEDERENFRLFKVLAAHGAGQIEFLTFAHDAPETVAAMEEIRAAFKQRRGDMSEAPDTAEGDAGGADFLRVLAQFPNTDLATRLFTTIENGRIDFLLRTVYRGIRRDLDFVRRRLMERRPNVEDIPAELLPFELLFQLAICGGATPDALRSYPTVVRELDRILGTYIFREDATVADSLIATRHVYEFFVEQPSRSNAQSEETGESSGEMQSDEASLAEADAEQSGKRQQIEVRDDPFSLWNSGQQQDISPDQDIFNRLRGPESAEQDLEKGDRAFYYDEWDRELADYRTRWCRIIERGGPLRLARVRRARSQQIRRRDLVNPVSVSTDAA